MCVCVCVHVFGEDMLEVIVVLPTSSDKAITCASSAPTKGLSPAMARSRCSSFSYDAGTTVGGMLSASAFLSTATPAPVLELMANTSSLPSPNSTRTLSRTSLASSWVCSCTGIYVHVYICVDVNACVAEQCFCLGEWMCRIDVVHLWLQQLVKEHHQLCFAIAPQTS